jgi:hypothetical protein
MSGHSPGEMSLNYRRHKPKSSLSSAAKILPHLAYY